jgi:hypothetical protein
MMQQETHQSLTHREVHGEGYKECKITGISCNLNTIFCTSQVPMKEKVDQINEKSRRTSQTENACTAEHWQNQQGKSNTCLSANKVSRNDGMFIEVNMNQALGQWPQHFLSRMENTNIMGKCFKWCKLWFSNTRTSKHLSWHQWPVKQLSTRCPIHQLEKLQVACKKVTRNLQQGFTYYPSEQTPSSLNPLNWWRKKEGLLKHLYMKRNCHQHLTVSSGADPRICFT